MGQADDSQRDVGLDAARDGWGVTLRYFLIRHGTAILRWVFGTLLGAVLGLVLRLLGFHP